MNLQPVTVHRPRWLHVTASRLNVGLLEPRVQLSAVALLAGLKEGNLCGLSHLSRECCSALCL